MTDAAAVLRVAVMALHAVRDAAAVAPAELPLTVLLVTVAVQAPMPPPLSPAELPLTVLLVSVTVSAWMPPPSLVTPAGPEAELPLTVLLVSVAVLRAKIPPPGS